MRSKKSLMVLAAAAATVPLFLGSPASAGSGDTGTYRATLTPVPHDPRADSGSNVTGTARLVYREDGTLSAQITVRGASPDLPHLVHIHGKQQAEAECPTKEARNDLVDDGLIETLEGLDYYGPIQVTFSTSGGTTAEPTDALALDRAPLADGRGRVEYSRTFSVPMAVGERLDDLHIVVHGEDLDDDGAYGGRITALGAPLEAELPVACGEIKEVGHGHGHSDDHAH